MEKAGPTVNPSQQRVLEGWLTDLPPEESTTVRVFFSSTFTGKLELYFFIFTHTHMYIHAPPHTHACMHAHARTHTHTHTHAYT